MNLNFVRYQEEHWTAGQIALFDMLTALAFTAGLFVIILWAAGVL